MTAVPDSEDLADMNDGDPAVEPADEYGPEQEPPGQPVPDEGDDQNPGFEEGQ